MTVLLALMVMVPECFLSAVPAGTPVLAALGFAPLAGGSGPGVAFRAAAALRDGPALGLLDAEDDALLASGVAAAEPVTSESLRPAGSA